MTMTDADAPLPTRRLLIVEDDDDTAELLSQQLERDGLAIDIARNGQEAILVIGETPPDIVVMDLMMPKLDGFETTRFFKAKFRSTFVPILVLTAKSDAQSRAKGARFGCEEYMTKPYDRKELLAAISVLLELGELENSLNATNAPIEAPADAPEFDLAGAQAAQASRRAELVQKIVDLRVDIAERQVSAGRPEIARVHVDRAIELDGGCERAHGLLQKLSHAG